MDNLQNKNNIRLYWTVIQFIMMLVWGSHLVYTDSYYSVYALCCGCAVLSLYDNYIHARRVPALTHWLGLILASFLSLAAALANYPIFQRLRNMREISIETNDFMNWYEAVLTFLCGIVVFYQIFICLASRFPSTCPETGEKNKRKRPVLVFGAVFIPLLAIYLIYLFFVVYPGSVTSDSIHKVYEVWSGNYSNHHPFWHTQSIRVCLNLGYALFQNSNAAAATYSFVQSLAMAATFAYAAVTLYQYGIPKLWMMLMVTCFAVLPNHITYSCTMWKDVPFGLTMLVLVVAMFRIIRNVGKNRLLNYVMLMVGGIGSCIMRSNGWYAMIAALVMLVLFFRKRCKELLLPWVGIVIVGWILMVPVQKGLGVDMNNFIEGLSVPLQQVARVITEGHELEEDEIQLIDTILDIELVPEKYDEQCVDNIKDLIRSKNYDYLKANKGEFLKLWSEIGLRYPWEYVEAWVEETKGYWNSGYDYYIYAQYVSANDYGMYMVRQDNLIHNLMKAYFTFTRETVLFEPFQSIGFQVWILSFLCFLSMAWGRKEFLLTVPVLAVVFTLWLTTPVFSEFRYAYSIFTTVPFLLPVCLCRKENEAK